MIFKKIWETIKKVIGFLCHRTEKQIPVIDQLEMMKKDLLEQKQRILNDPVLMNVRGMSMQYSDELKRLSKKYAEANYQKKLKTLKDMGNQQEGIKVLREKKQLEQKIQTTKERIKETKEADKQLELKLNILDRKIEQVVQEIEDMKDRNNYAEQSAQLATLMNKLNDIDTSADLSALSDRITDTERVAHGTMAEFDRRSSSDRAMAEAEDRALLDEFNNL